jgi:hypothetical protein
MAKLLLGQLHEHTLVPALIRRHVAQLRRAGAMGGHSFVYKDICGHAV